MKGAMIAVACTACTATQSARTVDPGKAQVSIGLGRAALFEKDVGDGDWTGHVMVRFGIVDGVDLGLHLEHTAGAGGAGALAIDPKVRLATNETATLSLGMPSGITWTEGDEVEFEGGFLAPALYLSTDIAPNLELVSSVRYTAIFATAMLSQTTRATTSTGYGGTVGFRFADATRTWVVQPEVGILRIEDSSYLTFGMTIAVGN